MSKYFSLHGQINQLKDFVQQTTFDADIWDAKSTYEQARTLAHFSQLLADKANQLAREARENTTAESFNTMKRNYQSKR